MKDWKFLKYTFNQRYFYINVQEEETGFLWTHICSLYYLVQIGAVTIFIFKSICLMQKNGFLLKSNRIPLPNHNNTRYVYISPWRIRYHLLENISHATKTVPNKPRNTAIRWTGDKPSTKAVAISGKDGHSVWLHRELVK